MTKKRTPKSSPIKITYPDGRVEIRPAYNARQLKMIRETTSDEMTDDKRAIISVKCPTCGSRPGAICRTPTGRATLHWERVKVVRRRRRIIEAGIRKTQQDRAEDPRSTDPSRLDSES